LGLFALLAKQMGITLLVTTDPSSNNAPSVAAD